MKFYVTTAIDYLTGPPHLGHAYEKILADVIARYKRLLGNDTYFLVGTDEHGERILKLAASEGRTPKEFADNLSNNYFRKTYDRLLISYDDFIRTTEERHKNVVKQILQKVYDDGEIYFSEYEGLYSVGSERFVTEKELVNGVLPGDKDPPELRKEGNYFFKMEKHRGWLLEQILSNPDFIQPIAYRNEIIEILKEPIGDLSISRPKSRVPWGIELPWDQEHVTYVWFDALLNYYSALVDKRKTEFFDEAWHVIGKDILKPHAVFWPIMLKAAGLPMYHSLIVHAHILAENGKKMGKSLGNAIDPMDLIDDYGADVVRYTLLKDTTLAADSAYGTNILESRLTSDLANDLGNLLSRSVSMVMKYREGRIPAPKQYSDAEVKIRQTAASLSRSISDLLDDFKISQILEVSMEFVREINRYIAEVKPWEIYKAGDEDRLDTVLYTILEGLRIASVALEPAIPIKAAAIREQIGVGGQKYLLNSSWGLLPSGVQIHTGDILFPKITKDVTV